MLQHGLMASSDTWIANKDELAPAFRLAREGFDVWLGNNRGNKFSRHHRSINPDRNPSKFFDFSFEDLANYDVPAQINKVIQVTGRPTISYVGHSQGTSQMFAALAKNKDFISNRINFFGALAPIAKMQHVKQPILALVKG